MADVSTNDRTPTTPARPGMVRWYDIPQLARTGLQEFLSTTMGSLLDARRILPREDATAEFDYTDTTIYTDDGETFWFDYMADTGDGWNATYVMAQLLSRRQLTVTPPATGKQEDLGRGQLLILGGDEVYPVSSEQEYQRRLFGPFDYAATAHDGEPAAGDQATPPAPHVFLIPGNHDWYDNLESFTKLFCGDPSRLGIWHTRQRRSYFALKLPHNWFLWGIDVALRNDIDNVQLKFFLRQAEQLPPGSRVILCSAVPEWVDGQPTSSGAYRALLEVLVTAVETNSEGGQVPLFLAGDIHNYQRYTGNRAGGSSYKQTKIVSGGGGAFLHPTHAFPEHDGDAEPQFKCEHRYPDKGTSWRLTFWNLAFPLTNWMLCLVFGLMYFTMFARWSRDFAMTDLLPWVSMPQSPMIVVLIVLFTLALVKFAGLGGLTGIRKWAWGGLHALAHLSVAALVCLIGTEVQERAACHVYASGPVADKSTPYQLEQTAQRWHEQAKNNEELREEIMAYALPWVGAIEPGIVILLGGVLGGFVFGVYLLISLNVFKVHRNEAFCSLRVADYKNLLRFKVTGDGLEVYVIKVDEMPKSARELPPTSNAAVHDCLEVIKVG